MTLNRPLNMLLLAGYMKGERFMKQAQARGARVYLLTSEKLLSKPWPREFLTEVFGQQDKADLPSTLRTVSYLARTVRIDRLVGIDDYDIEVAAAVREHLRLPGMSESTARFFRDKLACRIKARQEGIPVPDFTGVFNNEDVAEFIRRVPAPWMLKPRTEASAVGITKVKDEEQLWKLLESMGDKRSYHLLEAFLPGDVYHVDSITFKGQVLLAEAHRCGTPPFNVAHGGGIFTTATIQRGSEEERDIKALNEQVLQRLGMVRGVSHVEFIKSRADGKFYLLETAARVGGAHIAETVEASTGINLWEEWANLEIAGEDGDYELPTQRAEYGGLLITLAKHEHPDLSAYAAPEVFYQAPEANHAGLVLRSADPERLAAMLEDYQIRFQREFSTSMPITTKPSN